MYRRYWTERKYIDGVPTEEYRKIDELYNDTTYGTYEDCMNNKNDDENIDMKDRYFTIEALEDGVIERNIKINFQYSLNFQFWKYWSDLETGSLTVKSGDKVRLKCSSYNAYYNANNTSIFKTLPKCKIYGNINSMYMGDSISNDNKMYERMFSYWFSGMPIVDASNLVLPYNTLTGYCYENMFRGCTALTKAPSLPATELASDCYQSMFNRCTALVDAPELPATKLVPYCYCFMFVGCTSLSEAPSVLPATELAEFCCYQMFYGCTSLTTVPQLPATELAENCYNSMFVNCTSLVNAPVLPSTKLAENCYAYMFTGCTSLQTAPALPATTLASKCYAYMFTGCSSLNYIKCLATDGMDYNTPTENWLYKVSPTGTFVKKRGVEWESGQSGIPDGWIVQEVD